jgi:cation:H+ antiporter
MHLAYDILILAASLFSLLVLSERLIDASVRIASAMRISKAVIGLTLLAYGSSLPEFTISVLAVEAAPRLAVANVIGSNIFTLTFILGLVALMGHLKGGIGTGPMLRDSWMLLAAVTLVSSLFYLNGGIGFFSGVLMASLLVIYTIYVLHVDRKRNSLVLCDTSVSVGKESAIILICFSGVFISGHFTVISAVNLAVLLGVSNWLIGATIVAAGTSLPEVMISLSAAKRGEFGMSLGNIIGSNIFTILWILGVASWIQPIVLPFNSIMVDLAFLAASTMVLLFYVSKKRFTRFTGLVLLSMYIAYLFYLIH